MRIVETVYEMQYDARALRQAGGSLGLVPTMGALHEGHLSLVRAAKAACDATVVSIFVNPTQFGPKEDLNRYPRTFDEDCAMLEREEVDLLFAPSVGEMYPADASTWVSVDGVGDRLDGASRAGHFRGVATIVAKLFHTVGPTHAFFGQKDAAQLAVLRKMVRDLNFDTEIVSCPIVREQDGLAMSSRNRFLSPEERREALVLSRGLRAASELIAAGVESAAEIISRIDSVLAEEPSVRVDYLAVVDPATLEDLGEVARGGLIALAAYVGKTRLIDNLLLPGESSRTGRDV